jgi:hypothetical protein
MKFTRYDGAVTSPFLESSPRMGWVYIILDRVMASHIVGIIQIMTGIVSCDRIIESNLFRRLSSDVCHDICFTLRFFLGTSGVAESSANGFSAVSTPIGQFLSKAIVLLYFCCRLPWRSTWRNRLHEKAARSLIICGLAQNGPSEMQSGPDHRTTMGHMGQGVMGGSMMSGSMMAGRADMMQSMNNGGDGRPNSQWQKHPPRNPK